MSLVAYASSDDDSQSEKEEETSNTTVLPKKKDRVKITIPSLKQFEEEKPEPSKKLQPKGGSGLFSILPPPKNSSVLSKPGFTPYVFSKKKEIKPNPQVQKQKQNILPKKTDSEDPGNSAVDEIEDPSEEVDFFSLNTKPDEQTSKQFEIQSKDCEAFDNHKSENYSGYQDSLKEVPVYESWSTSTEDDNSAASWNQIFPSSEAAIPETSSSSIDWGSSGVSNSVLPPKFTEDKEFLKLKGRNRKEDISIIDINADDQLTGKDQWIMQSLSQETSRPLKRRHDMPTSQQKRKHQITYLAFQAKERELDLKNQWAHNSRTRRETQAKYGF